MADTSLTQIIDDAFREANITAVGQSPTTAQQTEALRLLERYIASLFGNELGAPLEGIPFGTNNVNVRPSDVDYYATVLNYYIPVDKRVFVNTTAAQSFNLHPSPQDGTRVAISDVSDNFDTYNVTLVGNGRTIEGATSIVLNTAGVDRQWFYRADVGDWKRVTDLTISDDLPFPPEFDEMFAIGLSMRLAPRYGTQTSPESMRTYGRTLAKFRARYTPVKEIGSEKALTHLTSTDNFWGWSYPDAFERGYPFGG